MRAVFSDPERHRLIYFQSVLQRAGIPAHVPYSPKSPHQPALFVLHDKDYDEAITVLSEALNPDPAEARDWTCGCGESVPGNFDVCWNCSAER